MHSKNIVIGVLLLVLITVVGYLLLNSKNTVVTENTPIAEVTPNEPESEVGDNTEPLPEVIEEARGEETVLGITVNGNDVTAYHFGTGQTELLFIGGIHGGYSWNTSLLAYELIDYLDANPNLVPSDITITVIPVANPDGLEATVGTVGRFKSEVTTAITEAERIAGRFNANKVDLNRNFDCEWEATGVWQSKEVSGGTSPFSEPEAAAIKNYIEKYKPAAAVVWFSAEGKVYPSACEGAPSNASIELAATYAKGAEYPTEAEFNAYTITGDMVNWLAKNKIPAISVLLTNHKDTEWDKNLAGVEAVINAYAE